MDLESSAEVIQGMVSEALHKITILEVPSVNNVSNNAIAFTIVNIGDDGVRHERTLISEVHDMFGDLDDFSCIANVPEASDYFRKAKRAVFDVKGNAVA